MMKYVFQVSLAVIFFFSFTIQCKAEKVRAYIGTYTSGTSEGIYSFELDLKNGSASKPKLVAETVNPSFVAIHPNQKFLYAVNEIGNFEGEKTGAVSSFAIDAKTGALTFLNQHASGGGAPCHLVVDSKGKNVLVANYTGGSVASLPIAKDGKLGKATTVLQHKGSSVNERRQAGPHAHSINLDAVNRYAVVADLGLDKVLVYRFKEAKGTLVANKPDGTKVEPGSGPRHFAFHPRGKFAYVINELLLTVTAFAYDADKGKLESIQTITTLPEETGDRKGFSTAEVQVHPSGKFLYGSNRGHNSIVVYTINQDTGKLRYVENESTQGKAPRNFAIDPTGTFLLAENQGSDTIVLFRINQDTGELTATGEVIEAPTPVCVKFTPID